MLAAILMFGVASACNSEPAFYREDGRRSYGCYLDNPISHIDVTFSEAGRRATLIVGDHTHELTFRGERWFAEVYANSAVEMTLDPEMRVTTTTGQLLAGPCQ